jgi:tetratricopeptide (TPR) repeat protein
LAVREQAKKRLESVGKHRMIEHHSTSLCRVPLLYSFLLLTLFGGLLFFPCTNLATSAQAIDSATAPELSMRQHYDAAQRLLSSGDREQAGLEFRLFLASALRSIGKNRLQIGEYTLALQTFEKALAFAPNDFALRLDFARAAIAARDFVKAKSLAEGALDASPAGDEKLQYSSAHLIFGRALLGMGDIKQAKEQFEAAVALDPTFETGYALAKAELALADKISAAQVFAEMRSSFGDSASIHMDFGRAYAEADFPEEAIQEFKKALQRDNTMAGAHYSLGASYMLRSGDTAFPQAEVEFHEELAVHPNDPFSYSQLGYIAMNRHNLPEAESDLKRAAALNPQNPDNFILLGQIYSNLNRTSDAEAALHQAIAATIDPSRNHYQVRGAHYQLGRLLLQDGRVSEGKNEMRIAQDLLLQNRLQDQVNVSGMHITGYQFPKLDTGAQANTQVLTVAMKFEEQIGPAIADSYNNLGATAAADNNLSEALTYFEQAAVWNPMMEGLDYNWGRAAFSAKRYRQAALCLGRYLQANPRAAGVREPLGMSRFIIEDYAGSVQALAPLDSLPMPTPSRSCAAGDMTKASNGCEAWRTRIPLSA